LQNQNSKQKEQTISRKTRLEKWNNDGAVMKIKRHSKHSKKEYFPQPICS